MKRLIKKILSVLTNNFKLLRIKKNHFSSIIGKGLIINGGLFKERIIIGRHVNIGKYCRFGNTIKGEKGIIIEDNCDINNFFTAIDGNITIHNNCLIASYVSIFAGNHSLDPDDNYQKMEYKDVEIGEYSWIGEKAIILPGVKIGKRCVIGSGSVVTKSIPDYSMAVGNPAKIIKKYNLETKKWEYV